MEETFTTNILFRCSKTLRKKAHEQAEADGLALSEVLRRFLVRYVQEDETSVKTGHASNAGQLGGS